jgi:hypothetical protein
MSTFEEQVYEFTFDEQVYKWFPHQVRAAWTKAYDPMSQWDTDDYAAGSAWVDVVGGAGRLRESDLDYALSKVARTAEEAAKTVTDASTVTRKWVIDEVKVIVKSYSLATVEETSAAHTKALFKADEIIQVWSQAQKMCQTEADATVEREKTSLWCKHHFDFCHSAEMVQAARQAVSEAQSKSMEAVAFFAHYVVSPHK